MAHKDPEKRREYNNQYRRDRYKENASFRHERLQSRKLQMEVAKKWFRELKKTLACEVCGESHPATLDFHHKDPQYKFMEISNMVRRLMSKERILQEIEKCAILCSNCHRKEHWTE